MKSLIFVTPYLRSGLCNNYFGIEVNYQSLLQIHRGCLVHFQILQTIRDRVISFLN